MVETQSVTVIAGCGDIGRRLLRRLNARGETATALVRSAAGLAALQGLDCRAIQADFDQPALLEPALFHNARLFYFAPPAPVGSVDSRLRGVLARVGALPARLVLISTTGVYGDCRGDWVDETTPVRPQAERACRRADAERAAQQWASEYQRQLVILRVPGIYCADRLPLERLRRAEPVLTAAEAPYTNRIHAEDLAMICELAMQRAPSGEIYNACDGQPSTMTDYFNHVADFAGLPRPPQVSLAEAQQQVSAGMLSYLQESRRISNRKLLQQLGITLTYPDLQAALPL